MASIYLDRLKPQQFQQASEVQVQSPEAAVPLNMSHGKVEWGNSLVELTCVVAPVLTLHTLNILYQHRSIEGYLLQQSLDPQAQAWANMFNTVNELPLYRCSITHTMGHVSHKAQACPLPPPPPPPPPPPHPPLSTKDWATI